MINTPTLLDMVDLSIKVLTLLFLAAESQIAFKKKFWARGIITFVIWLTVFRLAILRSIAISAGLFGKLENIEIVNHIQAYLMGSGGSILTDTILLIGVIISFVITVAEMESKDNNPKTKSRRYKK